MNQSKSDIDKRYSRSKKGLVSKIYGNQKQSSIRRGHSLPTYSKEDLREWLYSQPLFHKLYDNYKRLDYQKAYAPSVDRKDDYLGYTINNIQLMTWKENNEKGYADFNSGRNRKKTRVVYQFNLDGSFVCEHYSFKEASRQTGAGVGAISNCCSGRAKTAGGFCWSYIR